MIRAHSLVPTTPQQPDVTARLKEALLANAALVAERATEAAHYKKMYDRASALAGIGVWECDLATNALTWTDGVYDLFEIERGSVIDRLATVDMYDPVSRAEMQRLRAQAIATCGSFTLDVQIRTARGNERWIRLTGDVECEDGVAVRLFGTKQDITDETHIWTHMRRMAEQDPLTGLANRGRFEAAFDGTDRRPLAALVLIDLDGFKQVNDGHGHAAGDECLRHIAERLGAAWPDARLVARLGGDEFAVLVDTPIDSATVDHGIRTTLAAIARPVPWRDTVLLVSASIGVAVPVDPADFDGSILFAQADAALYAAKAAGKGTARVHLAAVVPDRRTIRGDVPTGEYTLETTVPFPFAGGSPDVANAGPSDERTMPFLHDGRNPEGASATLRDPGLSLLPQDATIGLDSGLIATPC